MTEEEEEMLYREMNPEDEFYMGDSPRDEEELIKVLITEEDIKQTRFAIGCVAVASLLFLIGCFLLGLFW